MPRSDFEVVWCCISVDIVHKQQYSKELTDLQIPIVFSAHTRIMIILKL